MWMFSTFHYITIGCVFALRRLLVLIDVVDIPGQGRSRDRSGGCRRDCEGRLLIPPATNR